MLSDLIRRARAGDDGARNELFDRCRSYVVIVARAHVESRLQAKVDASDLVQQTLLEAHRGFRDFRGESEGEWLGWLKQILTRNAADFIRRFGADKRQARLEIPLRAEGDSGSGGWTPADGGESPSAFVMRHEQELLVSAALAGLPEDYQEVILLRNLQRLPFDDVARRMNRSRPAVQMLWMRAIKRLAELMPEV